MPDDAHIWLARAKGSLALARHADASGSDITGIFREDLCYLAQQAAEKAIKALYMDKGEVFRYTHSIEELLSGLDKKGYGVAEEVKAAVILTRYAVETRYPGLAEPLTEEDYREALGLAEAVIHWVEKLMQQARDT